MKTVTMSRWKFLLYVAWAMWAGYLIPDIIHGFQTRSLWTMFSIPLFIAVLALPYILWRLWREQKRNQP